MTPFNGSKIICLDKGLIKGFLPRFVAWEILQAIGGGAYSEVAIERAFRKYQLFVNDKALVTELVCGAVRQRLLLDAWIDYLAKVSASKQPPLLRWLFHVGLYQIFFMDRIPASAAVNTTVEIAKKNDLRHLAPVVNAVLRKALRVRDKGKNLPLLSNSVERLSQHYSMPGWFIQELIQWKGEKGAEIIAKASNQAPGIDLRVNCRRSTIRSVQNKLRTFGIETKSLKGCPNGLKVTSSSGDIRTWPGYKEGEWSVQDRSAQLIAPLLNAKAGECVLDACAAPGGKTTHLAELMDDCGELWAVDCSRKRLKRTACNVERLGLKCVNYLPADSTTLIDQKPTWNGYFHKILLDVPCSGLGTLGRNPDIRWRMSLAKINELILLQSQLLKGILPLLKSGGRIVYSTCTIHPSENSEQLQKFLLSHPKLMLIKQKQIWPGEEQGGDGFFSAIIDSV